MQDETYAPVNGTRWKLGDSEVKDELDKMNDPDFDGCTDAGNGKPGACPISETIDEKALEDGLAPESVTIAAACNHLFALSCGENNGNCFLYDISRIAKGESPILLKVFNLSPVSERKSPSVAYDDRTLGEVDPEMTVFVPAEESPTGKAGIMFGGAHSGTISFWEFECTAPVQPVATVFVGAAEAVPSQNDKKDTTTSKGGIPPAGIVGIVLAIIVVVGAVFLGVSKSKALKKEQQTDIEMVVNNNVVN